MVEAHISSEKRKILKYGMVGGGPGSFIGAVHRHAITIAGGLLTAGCFSRSKEDNLLEAKNLMLDDSRVYINYDEMAEREAALEEKIDFAVIVTPNNNHYGACKAFLENGISVMCEKPLTISVQEAVDLKKIAEERGCLIGVAYAYFGHVMAKEARAIIRKGDIGDVRVVMGEYPQEWLIDPIENEGHRQASWRTDPKQAGKSTCVGDIGSHIENMVSQMTGLRIKKLCANLDNFGEGRKLDTNAEILVRFDNGASGCYWCSQVAIGYDNGLKVRIFGTEGSVEFEQENSNYLKVAKKGQAPQIYSRGSEYISEEAGAYSRIPAGHPEGLYEAFSNMYESFSAALQDKLSGKEVKESEYGFATVDMGIDGVRFINKCVESANNGSIWVDVE